MGISGLLPMLKEISTPIHIQEWKGKRLAVDGYVWLHKGAYGCAEDIARGKPTTKYVNYAMHRVRMLKHFGITPLIVFDGGLLPSKQGTEQERERKRAAALGRANSLVAGGKASQAREWFVKAVDVTPAHAYQLIKALRAEGVEYVVAPYEADPQLAYLERAGIVDGIVTEDSDLLIFGCKNVLFKLDNEGQCVEVRREHLTRCREYNFAGWTDCEFRQMAILSGCDYLDSVPGMGLKTAFKLMRKHKTAEKVIQIVRMDGNLDVPRTYSDDFRRAELTFKHQRVWDPRQQRIVHLEPLPAGMKAEELPFIGAELEQDYARGVALGEIDPITKQPIVDLVPDQLSLAPTSFYNKTPTAKKTQPLTGKASIRNFFSPAAATPVALKPRASGSQPPGTPMAAAQLDKLGPVKTSKFFGNAYKSTIDEGKGKAKAKEVEVEVTLDENEDDDVEVLEVVEPPVGEEDVPGEVAEVSLLDEGDNELFVETLELDNLSEGERDDCLPLEGDLQIVDEAVLPGAFSHERRSSIVSSVAPISSPPCSPPPPEPTSSAERKRTRTDENKVPALSQLTQAVSSPAPTPVAQQEPCPLAQSTSRLSAVVVKSVQLSDLSSDPIDCSSDHDEATPRQDKRVKLDRITAARRRPSASRRSSSQDEEEERSEMTQAVVTDWKARFMSSASKPTPFLSRAKSTPNVAAIAPKSSVTPRPLAGRVSLGSKTADTPTPAMSVMAPVPLKPSGKSVPPRVPFVPISANVLDTAVGPARPELKRKPSSSDSSTLPSSEGNSSEGSETSLTGKFAVTNERLKKFAWRGSQVAL